MTPIFMKIEDDLKKNSATIISKHNGCGTAPGNLVEVIKHIQT